MAENKIEQYLIELMVSFREVEPGVWLLDDEEHNLPEVVVMYVEPLVVIRVPVMDAPSENRQELFEKLLELNASDLLHGAYALEKNKVILVDTLEYDTMDYAEFRATLDAFSLALAQHYPVLSSYRR